MLLLLLNLAQAEQPQQQVSLGGGKKPRLRREDLLQVPDWREEFRLARVRRSNEAAIAMIVAAVTSGMLDG